MYRGSRQTKEPELGIRRNGWATAFFSALVVLFVPEVFMKGCTFFSALRCAPLKIVDHFAWSVIGRNSIQTTLCLLWNFKFFPPFSTSCGL